MAELNHDGVSRGYDLVVGGAIDIENDAGNGRLRLEQASTDALQAAAMDSKLLEGAGGERSGKIDHDAVRSSNGLGGGGHGAAGFDLNLRLSGGAQDGDTADGKALGEGSGRKKGEGC